jgi:hypothetical protein
MTIITPNSISGINSITAQSNSLNFYTTAGSTLSIGASVSGNITGNVTGDLTGNVNSSGVSTVTTLRATSIVGVTTAGITTAYIGSVNDGPISGARNRIINGNFDVWQRGTSTSMSASSVYTIDRWITGGTGTTSRQTFTLGQTEVPGNSKYYAQYDISSNSQNYEFTQKIEGVETFAGEQVTLSFYARRTSGTINIGSRLVQYFGTGGSPSSTVVTSVSGGNLSLTTSWQKFVFTVSVPSISGKTIGSNNDDSLWVSFQINDTNTGTLQFAQVQLERGPIATPFERRPITQELQLCQRYYQVLYTGSWRRYVANVDRDQRQIAVTMRAAPTLTMSASGANLNANGSVANSTHLTIDLQYTAGGSGVIDLSPLSIIGSAEL